MKFSTALVFLAAAVIVVSGDHNKGKEEWKALSQECQKSTNTTLSMPGKDKKDAEGKADCKKGGVGKFMEMLKNETLACYSRCMVIGLGHMNEQNEIITESLEKAYENKDVKIADIAKKCTEENMQENTCTQAVQRSLCVANELFAQKKQVGKKESSN